MSFVEPPFALAALGVLTFALASALEAHATFQAVLTTALAALGVVPAVPAALEALTIALAALVVPAVPAVGVVPVVPSVLIAWWDPQVRELAQYT